MNVFSLVMLSELILGRRNVIPYPIFSAFFVFGFFIVVHYVALLPVAKHDSSERHGGVGAAWAYVSITFVTFVTLLIVREQARG